jgi:hypothetical protein
MHGFYMSEEINEAGASIEEIQEFLSRKISLPEDAFQRSLRQVLVVDGDGDLEFRPGAVK